MYNAASPYRSLPIQKNIAFVGKAAEDLRDFPGNAKRDAGDELDKVQRGLMPVDWKPMVTVGPGVQEIRIRDDDNAYRVIYVAKFDDAVYVLHCFQKKTLQTSQADIDIAKARYKEIRK